MDSPSERGVKSADEIGAVPYIAQGLGEIFQRGGDAPDLRNYIAQYLAVQVSPSINRRRIPFTQEIVVQCSC
jgi:hypothetical protein